MKKLKILTGNNLPALKKLKTSSVSLIYIDPPFNTGKRQTLHGKSYADTFSSSAEYIRWLQRRFRQCKRLLTDNGSLFVHVDPRESHYIKIALDDIFGRNNFRNEIVWAYDYGARSKKKWPCKHDVIFWYTVSDRYIFNYEAIDRIPYLAPSLVGREKASVGKTPTDVWWNTIVPTNGKERVGYPTQKPLAILSRIVRVHSNRGDVCLDFFAGSGSFGQACLEAHRKAILIDKNSDAIAVMKERLARWIDQ